MNPELMQIQAKLADLESQLQGALAAASVSPSSPEHLFPPLREIPGNGTGFPSGACVWWPYDTDVHPIPSGWEEATEMRGVYPVGYDPENEDYDAIGVGLGTNEWTGFDKHGGAENNHDDHILDHTHSSEANGASVDPTYVFPPGNENWCGSLALNSQVTGCTPSSGGISWCDESGIPGATAHSETDNRPRSFVGIWIRRPFPA